MLLTALFIITLLSLFFGMGAFGYAIYVERRLKALASGLSREYAAVISSNEVISRDMKALNAQLAAQYMRATEAVLTQMPTGIPN